MVDIDKLEQEYKKYDDLGGLDIWALEYGEDVLAELRELRQFKNDVIPYLAIHNVFGYKIESLERCNE